MPYLILITINLIIYVFFLKIFFIFFKNKYFFPFRYADIFNFITCLLIGILLNLHFFYKEYIFFTILFNINFFYIFYHLLNMINTSPRTKILLVLYENKKLHKYEL